jgi:hypothetical protein
MKIYKTNDDFLWLNVSSVVSNKLFDAGLEMYAVCPHVLVNESTEYLIETKDELESALNTSDILVCVELCHLKDVISLN